MMKPLVLAVAVALVSCGGIPKKGTTLIEDVRGYNDGVRWSHHTLSAQRIHPRERDAFLEERSSLEDDLRIGDYEVLHIKRGRSGKRAQVTVRYEWHLDSKGLVNRTTTRQKWARYGKRWLMVDEKRVRGDEMPGVAEPSAPRTAEKRGSKGGPSGRLQGPE